MPPEKDAKIAELLEPMLKKRLFVALSKAVAPTRTDVALCGRAS
jgi:hypothetical protein